MEKAIAILAAGIGSRYGGFKQMDPIGPRGEFIIDYSIYDAIRAGFNKVIFIIKKEIEQEFRSTIGKRIAKKIDISYAFQGLEDLPGGIEFNPERRKPWGTVQAILTCTKMVNSPFAIINADDFYGKDSYQQMSQFLDTTSSDSVDYCMVGYKLDNTLSQHGTVTRALCKSTEDDILESIVEVAAIGYKGDKIISLDKSNNTETELNKDSLVSMNIWGFTPTVFGLLEEEFYIFLQKHAEALKEEFVIPTAVNILTQKGKVSVKALSTSSKWFGITYPQDKQIFKEKILDLVKLGEYPDNLWK